MALIATKIRYTDALQGQLENNLRSNNPNRPYQWVVIVTMANKASALHILVDDEKQANDILAQLNNGANFQELAKKFSNCPSKRNGGDLGEFNKGDMVPAFDKAVFSCELLQPYGPVKTQFGYHIIKVLYRN